MADKAQVTFRAAKWNMIAARDLAGIADANEHDIRIFAQQVSQGSWWLFNIEYEGKRIGCVVWSVEGEGATSDIIVNAAAARPVKGLDVTKIMFEMFTGMAREAGARGVRCWTSREGLRRKLEKMGATKRYVMEILT